MPKPTAFASAEGTGKETVEVVGSNPAPGTNAGRRLTWRQPLGRPECPYAYRWVVPLGPLGSIRLHHWLRSDDARAAHDHPSDFVTVVLAGRYADIRERDDGTVATDELRAGSVRYRRAEHRHRVVVPPTGCWTLLWFSPPRRNWGFYVPRAIGGFRFLKSHKWFLSYGHHPCDQP